jgi:ABC-type glycerol-3-phosphate transport system substrate-binding protein
MLKLFDGRVLVSDIERSIDSTQRVLREVDIDSGGWGEAYPVDVQTIHGIYPAATDDPFDIYIDDGSHLMGYDLDTGEKTLILAWDEVAVMPGFQRHLAFPGDGRISMLINRGAFGADISADYVNLTRIARADLPDVQTITIGGFGIRGDFTLTDKVREYNALSTNYRVEVVDYRGNVDQAYWEDGSWYQNEMRFLTDLVTGRAPDIIIGALPFLVDMERQGYVVDLYTLIDADPILNRTDFLPNALSAFEAPNGTLPAIGYGFGIFTMIGLPETVGGIGSWTYADMLELMEQAEEKGATIIGEWTTSEWFLEYTLNFSGRRFIDSVENKAYLDSEEFIRLLEISSRLPKEYDDPWFTNTECQFSRMLRGEQLLSLADISGISYYQMYTTALGDDMVALGYPTQDGGAHTIGISGGFAISASGENREGAWDFLRWLFLPDTDWGVNFLNPMGVMHSFPLRRDLLDKMIAYAKIPNIEIDEDGNEIEGYTGGRGVNSEAIWYYALTDVQEKGLRTLIESASVPFLYNPVIMNIVREETPRFFAGERSAADTARVLQNRVQTYLSERG